MGKLNINNLIYVNKFMNTEELFGVSVTKEDIIKIITEKNFPSRGFIEYYNKILYDDLTYQEINEKNIKLLLCAKDELEKIGFSIKETVLYDQNFSVITESGIKLAMNSVIKYGDFSNQTSTINEGLAIFLVIMVVSVFSKYEESNGYSLSEKNMLNLSRISYSQFSNITPQNELQRVKFLYDNYINHNYIHEAFESKCGYSINFFIVMNLVYYSMSIKKINYIADNMKEIIKNSSEFDNFIADNTFDFSRKNEINFDFEIENKYSLTNPLIKFEGKYFVISPQELVSKCYNIIYLKLKEIFYGTVNSKKFRCDYGNAIERYCYDIAQSHLNNDQFNYYNLYKSFGYRVTLENKESPDFFIQQGKNLFIFEIKSTNRFDENITHKIDESSLDDLEKEIKNKFFNTAFQIDKRIQEIKSLNERSDIIDIIKNTKNPYYIVVSSEVININNLIWNKYLRTINLKNTGRGVIYLNFLEFEYLMTSMKYHPKTMTRVLDFYSTKYYNCNFFEFLSTYKKEFNFDKYNIFPENDFEELLKKNFTD